MTTPKQPRPPADLQRRGRAWWKAVHAAFELNLDEQEIVIEIARLLDTADRLQAIIDRDGLEVVGHAGQPRIHPGLVQLRSTQLAIGRLAGQLGLPSEDGHAVATTLSARGRHAARRRWNKTNNVTQLGVS